MNEHDLSRLREVLLNEFNEDELAALCQDIGLNYAKLPGMGAFGKTRELIAAAQARHAVRALLERVQALRPEAYGAAGSAAPARSRVPLPRDTPVAQAQSVHIEPIPSRPIEPTAADDDTGGRRSWWGFIVIFGIILILIIATVAATLTQTPLSQPAELAVVAQPTPTTPAVTDTPLAAVQASATEAHPTPLTATPTPTSQASPTAAPTQTSTPTAGQTPTSTATPTPSATPGASPVVSPTNPALLAVMTANERLIDYYSGKIDSAGLLAAWSIETSQLAIGHAARLMKKQLQIDVAAGDALQVSMKYVVPPSVIAQNGNQIQVNAREYWSYTTPTRNTTACETIDYHYTVSSAGGRYQVVGFRGDVVGVANGADCHS